MFQSLVITLREGIEASLIVGILIAYLSHSGNRRLVNQVWLGTGLAILASLVAGGIIFAVVGEFAGLGEQLFEGTALVVAVGVLSYMVIWMRRQARNIKGELQGRVDEALKSRSGFALGTLAFFVVVREGIETVLFLFAATRGTSAFESISGGMIGLIAAVIVGYLVYAGGTHIDLRLFFNATGFLLIFVAAGLLAAGVHEFEEAGLLPAIIDHVWDTSAFLSNKAGVGSFLQAILGYNSNPSLSEVMVYFAYLAAAFWHFFSPEAPRTREIVAHSTRS